MRLVKNNKKEKRFSTYSELARQSANASLGRAQALREASLSVMGRSAKDSRGPAYSYAHPMFWAPFVVVGDGG